MFTRYYNQTIVLWTPTTSLSDDGEPVYNDPIETKAHWEEYKYEVVDLQGDVVLADMLLLIPDSIPVSSIVSLGKIRDLPTTASGLYKVINSARVTDLKNRKTIYEAALARYKDAYPTT